MNRLLVGVVGGSIGSDPFHHRTWSGSSLKLFTALQRNGSLARAFGSDLPRFTKYAVMAKNFHPDRAIWRKHFYMDPTYRALLTRALAQQIHPEDLENNFLQIGAMFNIPQVLKGRTKCFSFHDGTVAEFLRSAFASPRLSKKRTHQALAYERELYHSVDGILAMSEYHRQSFINDFDVPPNKVTNVGCAPNMDSVPDCDPKKDYDTRELVFIGIDFDRKGGPNLLRAFARVNETYPDAKLHIIGPRQLNIPAGLERGVVHHGFLSRRIEAERAELERIMRRSVIFVLPSLYEGVGISTLEAMLYQMPCIVTDGWGFRDSVHPGKTGDLVPCGDVGELADKLIHYLGRPDDLKRMGKEGRSMVLAEFTWEKVADRIVAATTHEAMSTHN